MAQKECRFLFPFHSTLYLSDLSSVGLGFRCRFVLPAHCFWNPVQPAALLQCDYLYRGKNLYARKMSSIRRPQCFIRRTKNTRRRRRGRRRRKEEEKRKKRRIQVFTTDLSTYLLRPLARGEQKPSTILRSTQFWAVFFSSFQQCPILNICASVSLSRVFLGLPFFLFPCGFQVRACLVMLLAGFLRMWPIQPHFLLQICSATSPRFISPLATGHTTLCADSC